MSQDAVKNGWRPPNGAVEYQFGAYRARSDSLTLLYQGAMLPLAPKVVKTLIALLDNAGRIVSKDELLQLIWDDSIVEEANLSQNVYSLRRIFDATSGDQFIETLPRRGYRFTGSVSQRHIVETKAAQPARRLWVFAAVVAVVCSIVIARWAIVGKAPAPSNDLTLAAEQQYALGWHYWHESTAASLQASARHFDLAIHDSPHNPLGYAGEAAAFAQLADIYDGSPSGVVDAVTAWRLSQQALALDPSCPLALAVRGYVEFDQDGNNGAAAHDLRRAATLDPSLDVAHLWYGAVLLWQGNPHLARIELERAESLDSRLPSLYYLLALDFYMSRDYKNAVAFGKLALSDQGSTQPGSYLLAAAHEQAGQYQSAIQDVRHFSSSPSDALAVSDTLAHVYASMGDRTRSQRELHAVERLSQRYQHRPVLTAIAYLANGQLDEAFAWLSRLPQSDRQLFALDPRFDPIRRDRRFARWLHG